MTALLLYSVILSGLLVILGALAFFQPGLLSQIRLAFWEGPGQVQDYARQTDAANQLMSFENRLKERRAKIHRIVRAVCDEEIGLGEATRRVLAIEREGNLPPLRLPELPKEEWREQLHLCLIEQVALELSAEPEKAAHLLPRLKKEIHDLFGN